jgi:Transglutaminase-like superfamily
VTVSDRDPRPLLGRVAGLRHVGWRDWGAILVTVAAGIVVEIGIRTMRLPTLARWLGAPLADPSAATAPPTRTSGPSGPAGAALLPPWARHRLQICVRLLRWWPFDEKCLRLSLVCGWRIRRLRPGLVVGVALLDGQVKAHAWLTVDGVSLDPSGAADYAALEPIRP